MSQHELFLELTAIGMNLKQAKLYLAALQLGTVPASRIAARAEINRATAYHLLDEMAQSRYVIVSDRVGVKHYTATEPNKLLGILEERRMELARQQERLSGIVGLLTNLRQNNTVEPTVKLYQGRTGLKELLKRSLSADKVIDIWDLSKSDDRELIDSIFSHYVADRIKKGISSRVIANEYPLQNIDHQSFLREVRVMPSESLGVDIRIYNDVTVIASYSPEELFGVEIESPYIAKALKGIFNIIWHMLPADTNDVPKAIKNIESAGKSQVSAHVNKLV